MRIGRPIIAPSFRSSLIPRRVRWKQLAIQKIFRRNSHVPWPVHWTSTVKGVENIVPGTRFPGLSKGCHLDGRNGIVFGENVWVGPRVSIISMNHDVYDYERYIEGPPIRISANCWLGAGATILPGVILGPHTVVGAGAVVTKSFPEGDQILGGVPARCIKKLGPYAAGKRL